MKKHFILSLVFIFSFACSISRAETQQYEILHTPEQEEARQRELVKKRYLEERGPLSLYPFGDFDKKNQNFYGIAPLVTYSPRDFYGLGAGIFSIVKGDFYGLEMSGIGITKGDFYGLKMSGIDYTKGDFTGIQMAGFGITRGDFTGIQMGVVPFGAASDFSGIQIGLIALNGGDFCGVQFSIYGSGCGHAPNTFFYIKNGNFTGLQASLTYNVTSGNFKGMQIGLVNTVYGELHGIQIGLWNECKQGNMPLINIRF